LLIVCGYIGARTFFVAFAWEQFAHAPVQAFLPRDGGFALYGAFLLDVLMIFVYGRLAKIELVGKLFDAFASAFVLMIAIGRWGDFFIQTSFGEWVSEAVASIPFLYVYIERLGEWHVGLFLLESLGALAIFGYVWRRRKRARRCGDVMWWALALYGGLRAVLESMRQDSLFFGFVRVAQVISILLLIGVTANFAYRAFRADIAKKSKILLLLAVALAALGAAFWAEFNMGQGKELVYRAILAGGVAIMVVVAFSLYQVTRKKVVDGSEGTNGKNVLVH
jgi:Prolipoprotein diacylglyceryltransferase